MWKRKACRSIIANLTTIRQQMSKSTDRNSFDSPKKTKALNPHAFLARALRPPTMDFTQICQHVLTVLLFNEARVSLSRFS